MRPSRSTKLLSGSTSSEYEMPSSSSAINTVGVRPQRDVVFSFMT